MTEEDILRFRLRNQLISNGKLQRAEQVVNWMGAIQAQDYGQAKYAVGCRLKNAQVTEIDQAINEKRLVRTWALRGTLHILAACDIHWMLPLVTSGIIARYQSQFKKLGLADEDFKGIQKSIRQLLEGGKSLTRKVLFEGLAKNNIRTDGLRGVFILYKAGWSGVICHGQMSGKQDTYTLLDEWLPGSSVISREEAGAKLARQYFQSHGPATLMDFTLWSGLSITEARAAFESIRGSLTKIEVKDQLYWTIENPDDRSAWDDGAYFLPGFDEYLLGYKDRSLILDCVHTKKVILQNGIFKPVIVDHGKIVGLWKKMLLKDTFEIELFDGTIYPAAHFAQEMERYSQFIRS